MREAVARFVPKKFPEEGLLTELPLYEGCPKSKFPYFIKNQWRDQASQNLREI